MIPSVKDIVAFRHSVPPDTTPAQIWALAEQTFGWEDAKMVTSRKYVQGVEAGHNLAQRKMLDELKMYTKDKPKTAQEAMQR